MRSEAPSSSPLEKKSEFPSQSGQESFNQFNVLPEPLQAAQMEAEVFAMTGYDVKWPMKWLL
jgi:hypothetical protein